MVEAEALVGSTIVIVVNSTYATEDWAFTWRTPRARGGFTYRCSGDIEADYLFFWEDQ